MVADDDGKSIKVKTSFISDRGHEETLTSAATGAVAQRPNSRATGRADDQRHCPSRRDAHGVHFRHIRQ